MSVVYENEQIVTTGAVNVGVVDIGSNTVHLIIVRTNGRDFEIVADEKEMARLGDDVSFKGELSTTKFNLVLQLLADYNKMAKGLNARLIIFGTEPLRAARNAAHLVQQAREKLGLSVQVFRKPKKLSSVFEAQPVACICRPILWSPTLAAAVPKS